jgi:CoA-transferase family III
MRVVAQADILLEGFRPGVAERLGIGPDDCLMRQPSCQAIGIRRRFSSRLLTRSNEAELKF